MIEFSRTNPRVYARKGNRRFSLAVYRDRYGRSFSRPRPFAGADGGFTFVAFGWLIAFAIIDLA